MAEPGDLLDAPERATTYTGYYRLPRGRWTAVAWADSYDEAWTALLAMPATAGPSEAIVRPTGTKP